MSKPKLNRVPANVRSYGDLIVTIESGNPWPSAYRGSKYTIRTKGNGVGLYLNHRVIELEGTLPQGLHDALKEVGKSGGSGLGSIRVTANREVLTKINAENYRYTDQAFVSDGWIPVYLGKLSGNIEFSGLSNDPNPSTIDPPCVWEGLPFNHGETWSMTIRDGLQWRIKIGQKFSFASAYSHDNLERMYKTYRPNGGRLRCNEYGHVWMELPNKQVQKSSTIREMIEDWFQDAQKNGRNQVLNLIHRRLEATGNGDASKGRFPIYLGHISEYDDGNVPTPVISDQDYFVLAAKGEDL